MNSDNNLHFESILSEWTDFCRLRDEGEDGEGLVWKKGEGICPQSQRGICAVVQYSPVHVRKVKEWEQQSC